MKIVAEVSAGELIDKITILEIKLRHIADEAKHANVAREYSALTSVLNREMPTDQNLSRLRAELKAVNAELWRIEDEIRAQERAQTFGARFIALARAVYRMNDKRMQLKRDINLLTKSELVEEKFYEQY